MDQHGNSLRGGPHCDVAQPLWDTWSESNHGLPSVCVCFLWAPRRPGDWLLLAPLSTWIWCRFIPGRLHPASPTASDTLLFYCISNSCRWENCAYSSCYTHMCELQLFYLNTISLSKSLLPNENRKHHSSLSIDPYSWMGKCQISNFGSRLSSYFSQAIPSLRLDVKPNIKAVKL